MTLPGNVGVCTVTGKFTTAQRGTGSGAPISVPMSGTVTLTPSNPRMLDVTATPPITIVAAPIVSTLDGSGVFTVEVVATDDTDVNPTGFTYKATFDLTAGGNKVTLSPIDFAAPQGTSVDLTVVTPVGASGGILITRGPGVPVGGTTGQVLTKVNGTDLNTEWADPTGGGGSGLPTGGSNGQFVKKVSGAGAWASLAWSDIASGVPTTFTPAAHASTHAAAGSDPVTIAESQVTNLSTDLAAKAALASPTFTGHVTVPTPTTSTDAVTKAYADALAQGYTQKAAVQLATAAALPTMSYSAGVLTASATGTLTVDGVLTTVGMRILVKNEGTTANNGIYTVTTAGAVGVAAVLTRATDLDTGAEIPGASVYVEGGTTNGGAGYVVASIGPFTVGTTAINWTQFSGAGEVLAGHGIAKTGNTLSTSGLASTDLSDFAAAVKTAMQTLNVALTNTEVSGTYPNRPAYTGVVIWIGADQPTAGGTTSGGTPAAVANLDIWFHTA